MIPDDEYKSTEFIHFRLQIHIIIYQNFLLIPHTYIGCTNVKKSINLCIYRINTAMYT